MGDHGGPSHTLGISEKSCAAICLSPSAYNRLFVSLLQRGSQNGNQRTGPERHGGRQELADKEAAEIKHIEAYLPKAMGEEEITAAVKATIAEMGSPTMKDMGTVMKNVMARLQASGARVEGKMVSEIVKKNLVSG